MPYNSMDYQPPPLPDLGDLNSFGDVRSLVQQMMRYLQHLQASQTQFLNHLKGNTNEAGSTEAMGTVPAAATIAPTKFMNVVTGSAAVSRITTPLNYSGQIML